MRCFVTNQTVWPFLYLSNKRNYNLKAHATEQFYSRAGSLAGQRTGAASSQLQQEESQSYDAEEHKHVDEEQHPPAAVQPVGHRSPARRAQGQA